MLNYHTVPVRIFTNILRFYTKLVGNKLHEESISKDLRQHSHLEWNRMDLPTTPEIEFLNSLFRFLRLIRRLLQNPVPLHANGYVGQNFTHPSPHMLV